MLLLSKEKKIWLISQSSVAFVQFQIKSLAIT